MTDSNEPLLMFEKDGVKSYFDLVDGKWKFWGDVEVDESAKQLFEKLAEFMPALKPKL